MKKTKMIMLPAAGSSNPLGKTWNTLKAAAQVKKVREFIAKYNLGWGMLKMIMLPGAGSSNPLGKTWNTLKAAAQVKKVREFIAKYNQEQVESQNDHAPRSRFIKPTWEDMEHTQGCCTSKKGKGIHCKI